MNKSGMWSADNCLRPRLLTQERTDPYGGWNLRRRCRHSEYRSALVVGDHVLVVGDAAKVEVVDLVASLLKSRGYPENAKSGEDSFIDQKRAWWRH